MSENIIQKSISRWAGINQDNFELVVHEMIDGKYRRYSEEEWIKEEKEKSLYGI